MLTSIGPRFIVAHGKIDLNHLSLPSGFGRPLEIDEISVNAKGDRMTVDRANFVWGGKAHCPFRRCEFF